MTRTIFVGTLAALVLVASGITYAVNHAKPKTVARTVTPQASPNSTPSPTPDQSTSGGNSMNSSNSSTTITSTSTSTINGKTTIAPVTINLDAGDEGSDQTYNVSKGAQVTVNFHVVGEVYDGGLQFKGSNGQNTGTIGSGKTGTLSFTANSTVVFNPFWPDGTPKTYDITINAI